MAFSGVRSSWLILARKLDLVRLMASAWSRDAVKSFLVTLALRDIGIDEHHSTIR